MDSHLDDIEKITHRNTDYTSNIDSFLDGFEGSMCLCDDQLKEISN